MQPTHHRTPNALIRETSPYLLQHAYNPVQWQTWSIATLEQAAQENKPILVSIGYAACHWCHVMERESFEDEQVAAYMNKHFVNIKIDREERPDIDHIYMDAVQAMTGSGGWPLNCFLLPDGRPFYGGTYFPPKQAYNRPSWMSVLQAVVAAFHQRRDELERQAEQLHLHLENQNPATFRYNAPHLSAQTTQTISSLQRAYDRMQQYFDTENGGFGGAPKFPATMSLDFLLHWHYTYPKTTKEGLQHALFSLDRLIYGGIYDHIGGGFSRYTVDNAWQVPHFEKMLYDNALLIATLADAYKITKSADYEAVIRQTLAYIAREMTSPENLCYAAYDADSEGVEGKYYTWQYEEILQLLPDPIQSVFIAYYNITPQGNWEHRNILHRNISYKTFAEQVGIDETTLIQYLEQGRQILFDAREKRTKPTLDDKCLMGWNALMAIALDKAGTALSEPSYLHTAQQLVAAIEANFYNPQQNSFYHTYKNGKANYWAYLDDYAFYIAALLVRYQVSFDKTYLQRAETYTKLVLTYFNDPDNPLFFYTDSRQTDLPFRKKEWYDNATPSGNAVMADNLFTLGKLLENENYTNRALTMLASMGERTIQQPNAFAYWLKTHHKAAQPHYEVAIVGKQAFDFATYINQYYLPDKVLLASIANDDTIVLLQHREVSNSTQIYACSDRVCATPFDNPQQWLHYHQEQNSSLHYPNLEI